MKIDAKALFDLAELYPDSAQAEDFLAAYELEDDAAIQKTGKLLVAHLLEDGVIDKDEAEAITDPEHASPVDDLVEKPDFIEVWNINFDLPPELP